MTNKELQPIICPSLLSGDFAFLARDANYMLEQGAECHFVPNLTIGAPVIKSLRKHTKGHLDCHLMVTNPESMIDDFKNAGADGITFHIEATERGDGRSITKEVIHKIKSSGMMCGISVKPNTPIESIFDFVESIDFVLIMTVEPGFGGQSFMTHMMPKVETLRKKYPHLPIQVDGGLDPNTIDAAAKAGANIIVAGSSLFKPGQNPKDTMQLFRDTINKHKPNCICKISDYYYFRKVIYILVVWTFNKASVMYTNTDTIIILIQSPGITTQ
ncbi:ribulose phosphate 3-epimerase [Heterostelium album PN500]|uniref:ribulose-phosphate 3-epimerase n=1 Tax=Heterostelium pallidum (strain ATCC 26659 / Pp 5 / PN500) TaxID=670386 RepID=D3BN51_HETP5|nr:ribulose phosphate 3-epimerase [Heterostelium album PN500]EFA77413.1 ribulose phosphate 3-epimerase [Heterostelium album PN500]|eukprot:XP_020429542.1 ribulose phosphate 3-epimerase [Heterostelium album PN500]